jgi:hypothetical protein
MNQNTEKQRLIEELDELQDAMLVSLSTLNLLHTFTEDELEITKGEIEASKQIEVQRIERYESYIENTRKQLLAIDNAS